MVIADYTSTEIEKLPQKYQEIAKWGAAGTSAPGLLHIHHDFYTVNMPKLGFEHVNVTDITERTMPMLRLFRRLSFIPFQFIKLAGSQPKHTNGLMAYYGIKVAKEGWWKFVIVSAKKR